MKAEASRMQMHVPFMDLAAQTAAIKSEMLTAISDVVQRGDFILGQAVDRFERAFAKWLGVSHAIGVGNGLDALRLSLLANGIVPGDEVILPANTFIATALAVSDVGATPILVDCDDTFNLDVRQLSSAVTARTRAIIPVHLTGQPAEMDSILSLAREKQLIVIEDACQAHGAYYRGKACGSLGSTGCFSFYPAKNLGAMGDGGLVTTNDNLIAQRIRRLRHYGQEAKYEHVVRGMNSRLDSIQAAVLDVKLRFLDDENARRVRHAARYRERLQGLSELSFQQLVPETSHVYHLFIVETHERDALREWLSQRGVEAGLHYPVPIHLQRAYTHLGKPAGSFPRAEALARRCLSLPMFPSLKDSQVDYVTECIADFFKNKPRPSK